MIGQFLTNIFEWVVMSSKNPEATSLTLKGSLVAVATVASISFGLGHIVIPITSLTPIVDMIIQWVQTCLLVVSLTASIYGAIRKVWLSATGKNPVTQ